MGFVPTILLSVGFLNGLSTLDGLFKRNFFFEIKQSRPEIEWLVPLENQTEKEGFRILNSSFRMLTVLILSN
jgi:hypothetical protein